jgi:hypothetical protein
VDPDGRDVAVELSTEGGGGHLLSAPLERCGLYQVLLNGTLHGMFAVNPDAKESALAPLGMPELTGLFPAGRARVLQVGADLARRVREARFGRELWRETLALALLLLGAEMVIARLGMGEVAPAKGIEAAGSRPAPR